jgi:F-type H+-transporting ATPase subunit c
VYPVIFKKYKRMEVEAAKALAAGLAIGIGAVGSAVGEGIIAGKAMEAIGRNPEVRDKITTLMFVTMAIAESTAIYALVISLILLFG